MTPRTIWMIAALIVIGFWSGLIGLVTTTEAKPTSQTEATWYGPGFYGNRTACGLQYSIRHRGVAVPSGGRYHLRCGTKLTICRYRHRFCRKVRVTDTGSFRDHRFDLSARIAMDLCKCWKPYTMKVWWHRGWDNRRTNGKATALS